MAYFLEYAVPLRNQRGEELFILANCQKKGSIIAMLLYFPIEPEATSMSPRRSSMPPQ